MNLRLANLAYAVVLVLLVLLASCAEPYHQKGERYLLVATNINLPYWQEAKAGLMDAARVLGVQAEFTGPASYAPYEQVTSFLQAVASRPAGILLSAARPDLFKKAVDEAIAQGIPVICMDSDVPDSRRVLFIGTDNYRAGVEIAKRIVRALNGSGRVVIITIPGQFNLDERLRGVVETFHRYPKMKVAGVLDDKGDSGIAYDLIAAMVEKKERFDGVVGLEASGGRGAADALHRFDLTGKIPVVAMDKDPETLDWIVRGGIVATIAQKPYTMSFYGLRFLDDLHHNVVRESADWKVASPVPTMVDTGTMVVDATNVKAVQEAQASRRQGLPTSW